MIDKKLAVLTLVLLLVACAGPSPTVEPMATVEATPLTALRVALLFPTKNLIVGEEGKAAQRGALLAIEQRNSTGGVLGADVEPVIIDSGCSAERAQEAIDDATAQGLTFFIGGLCATEASVISDAVAGKGVFLALHGNPRVATNDAGEHRTGVYATLLPDALQAQAMAHFALDRLHAKTAATLHDARSPLSTGLAKEFARAFVESGGQVVETTSYDGFVRDYTAELEPIAAHAPDVLLLPNCAPEANDIATQAHKLGIDATLLGCDSWSLDLDADAVEEGYYCVEFTPLDPRDQVGEFLAAYRERFDCEADSFSAWGYDTARALLDAIKTAGSVGVEDVEQALLGLTFDGLTGLTRFDDQGRAHKNLAVIRVTDGKEEFDTRGSP
ncbi:MAG: ABC transporter substrate-binding protein [Chloroflexota bacterium]